MGVSKMQLIDIKRRMEGPHKCEGGGRSVKPRHVLNNSVRKII